MRDSQRDLGYLTVKECFSKGSGWKRGRRVNFLPAESSEDLNGENSGFISTWRLKRKSQYCIVIRFSSRGQVVREGMRRMITLTFLLSFADRKKGYSLQGTL
jgi:hypothetical protein